MLFPTQFHSKAFGNHLGQPLDMAQQCGGVAALKRLVDWLTDMQRW